MIIRFDGGYGRSGEITADIQECCGCGKITTCIVMDASDHEYTSGSICKECIEKMLNV